jgi:hypothetical protein
MYQFISVLNILDYSLELTFPDNDTIKLILAKYVC